MGACAPIVFQKVTRPQFETVKARACADATEVEDNGDTGWAKGPTPVGDVTVSWIYNEPAQMLTVQCTDKPRLLPAGIANSKIQSLVGSALNA